MTACRTINVGESAITIPLEELWQQALQAVRPRQPLTKRIPSFVFFLGRLNEIVTLLFSFKMPSLSSINRRTESRHDQSGGGKLGGYFGGQPIALPRFYIVAI